MINHKAIYSLYPNVAYIDGRTAYDSENNVIVYDESLVSQWTDPNLYKEQRLENYPNLGDQLDMLWHAIDNGSLNKTSEFYTAIKAVKDAYPKSE